MIQLVKINVPQQSLPDIAGRFFLDNEASFHVQNHSCGNFLSVEGGIGWKILVNVCGISVHLKNSVKNLVATWFYWFGLFIAIPIMVYFLIPVQQVNGTPPMWEPH